MIRVVLPFQLRALAHVGEEVQVDVPAPATLGRLLDAIESAHPALRGTIRDHLTLKRRPFVRFFACKEDISQSPPDTQLPGPIATGSEPFLIIGALAGG